MTNLLFKKAPTTIQENIILRLNVNFRECEQLFASFPLHCLLSKVIMQHFLAYHQYFGCLERHWNNLFLEIRFCHAPVGSRQNSA